MKVILLKPVRKLGKIGETVDVKPGFGRNFLVPQGFAVRATESNKKLIEARKSELEAKNKEAKKYAEEIAKKVEGKDFTFIRQSAADGRLFGSVSGREIAKVLLDAGYEVSYANVHLESPIKNLGVFEVHLVLHSEVTSNIIVNVARSSSEAVDALRAFKNPVASSKTADVTEVAEDVSNQEDSAA
ncbi:MAG: 50S ribosomal protein L9 [Rickettsiaceae bacterium]|nr:50S ribosomal protein L9 [Rickettsiaceae bacterium]